MANPTVGNGIFGPSLHNVLQTQNQGLLNQAATISKLNAQAPGVFGAALSGLQMGHGIHTLLNGVGPQVSDAIKLRHLSNLVEQQANSMGINLQTHPKEFTALTAHALMQAGYPNLALQAVQKGNVLAQQQAALSSTQATTFYKEAAGRAALTKSPFSTPVAQAIQIATTSTNPQARQFAVSFIRKQVTVTSGQALASLVAGMRSKGELTDQQALQALTPGNPINSIISALIQGALSKSTTTTPPKTTTTPAPSGDTALPPGAVYGGDLSNYSVGK